MPIRRWICWPLVGFAVMATGVPVLADTRDFDTDVPMVCKANVPDVGVPPAPGTSSNDGAFPHFCTVGLLGGSWQASTGEWTLLRIGWGTDTEQDCKAFLANVTVTILFQGSPVAFDTTPCQQKPFGWVTQSRVLMHPLQPGSYSATFIFVFNAAVFDGSNTFPAGFVIQPPSPSTLTVVPQG